jgi:DNA-binding XRE family transcriptional regulator
MAKTWKEVRKTLSPEAEERIQKQVKEAAAVMRLQQLREARNMTQVTLAQALQVNQGSISKIEKKADMYVSTLRSYIEAMGGHLNITAEFDGATVNIDLFENLTNGQDEQAIA